MLHPGGFNDAGFVRPTYSSTNPFALWSTTTPMALGRHPADTASVYGAREAGGSADSFRFIASGRFVAAVRLKVVCLRNNHAF